MRSRQLIVVNGACLLLTFWALPSDGGQEIAVESDAIRGQLTRDIVIVPRIKEDGYTAPETSQYISLPTVRFRRDSAELLPIAEQQLREVAAAIKAEENRIGRILVEGHTCDLGTPDYNLGLSELRAQTVRQYLIEKGVPPRLLDTKGRGESRPVIPNSDESCRARNRRVDFVNRIKESDIPRTRGLTESRTSTERFLEPHFEAIVKSQGGKRYSDDAIDTLQEGDHFKADFRVLEGCHVYPLFCDSAGQVNWLRIDAPTNGDWVLSNVELAANGFWCYFGSRYFLPNSEQYYVLDNQAGQEILCLIATSRPVPDSSALAALLKSHGKALGAQTVRDATGVEDAEVYLLDFEHLESER